MALPVHERERSTEKYSEVGAARRRRRASSSLRPTPRRILTIDRNDGRWQVEARRGHGPHGRGRRRVRCPTGRTCGRWRVTIWSPCQDDSPPPSPACPEHPAIFLATAFYCAPRVVSLRSERTKRPWQEKQLNARALARRGNCALGTQPPNPRAPPNTAPHLRSAGVVVVGLAASPAASAPIGHAAPPAAGAKGRPRQSKARRGLASFLKFEVTIMDQSDDASHNVA